MQNAFTREHVELPAGRLETTGREVSVRVMGEALDIETLKNLVVRETSRGATYLKDVALSKMDSKMFAAYRE